MLLLVKQSKRKEKKRGKIMSTSKKSHKLTTFGLVWYFITAALMLILLVGHFALLFDAAGLLKLLRLKFWMTGIYGTSE